MICPNCGVLLPDDVDRCGKCGFELSNQDLGKTVVEGELSSQASFTNTVIEETSAAKTVFYVPPEEKPLFGWLVIVEGENQWREFRLPAEEGQFLIGRDESCFIRLEDPNVERFHASLRIKEGKLFITDLDTDEKTLLEGKPIVKEEVPDGAILQVGSTKLKFRKF